MQDDYQGDVIFLSIVREDNSGEVATPGFAESYGTSKGMDNIASFADVGGNWGPFMGGGYPTNVIINLETMEYRYKRGGLMTGTEVEGKIIQELAR